MDAASLTRSEAEERSRLLAVTRYDIDVDLTGLLEGDTFRAVSTITFTCAEPGASTFVDCAADVERAELNGRRARPGVGPRGPAAADGPRRATTCWSSATAQSDTASSSGILRTVDPSDGLVYVWTSFEPDEARRMWACFDQPDLKAPHRFVVDAPESWTVTSNTGPETVSEAGRRRPHLDASRTPRRSRRTSWSSTPARSTRCAASTTATTSASTAASRWSRRSSATSTTWSRSPARGWRSSASSSACRSRRSTTTRCSSPTSAARWRTGGASPTATPSSPAPRRATPSARCSREFVLHEMAHMWFGDLVTMRWWDDLWLNEAFASWASNWALVARHRVRRPVGGLPRALQARRLRHGHGPGHPPDPRRRARRRPRDRQLRLDHLRQGPERAPPADGLHRRGARSSAGCRPTSATTPGATPSSTT